MSPTASAIVAGAAGIFALLVLAFQTVWFRRTSRDHLAESDRFMRLLADMQSDSRRSGSQDFAGQELFARAVEEFSFAAQRIDGSVHRLDDAVSTAMSVAGQRVHIEFPPETSSSSPPPGDDSGQTIRELAHSLGTPLAQIKAESIRLSGTDKQHKEAYGRIMASVDLCNSFITSFREIARLSTGGPILSLESLSKAIKTTTDIYMARDSKEINLDLRVPPRIDGYTNTYLLSVLAPLIENAVEGSLNKAPVIIVCDDHDEEVVFRISNHFEGKPPSDESFLPGRSTKESHEGMGLSTVNRLVESQRNGHLELVLDGDVATFIVRLPGRRHG
jgi:K+-sensing histidine kinase KdpD